MHCMLIELEIRAIEKVHVKRMANLTMPSAMHIALKNQYREDPSFLQVSQRQTFAKLLLRGNLIQLEQVIDKCNIIKRLGLGFCGGLRLRVDLRRQVLSGRQGEF